MIFAVLPLSLFVFKISKMFFLYRLRVQTGLRQSLATGLAGLTLSHALLDAREELLFMAALGLAAAAALVSLISAVPRLPGCWSVAWGSWCSRVPVEPRRSGWGYSKS